MVTSSYEQKVINLLRSGGYKFVREKSFSDLRCGKFRYDFYLPDINTIIEVDGEAHFHIISRFHRNRQDFLRGQENDRRKNSYALANNIPLYRIPYWDIKDLKTPQDLFKPKYLVTSKFHNDFLIRKLQSV